MLKTIQRIVGKWHAQAARRCDDWAGNRVNELKPRAILDVGCYDGSFLSSYLNYSPSIICGIEADCPAAAIARRRGFHVHDADLNGRWPWRHEMFDVVLGMQVIEHVHNTRMFVEETFRVLKPGGIALIGTDNITSLLNVSAVLMGYTPFSLARVCGWYLGNPFSLHRNEAPSSNVPIHHPAFAGVTGHIRILSVPQASEIFQKVGFTTKVRSIGLTPLPDRIGRLLEPVFPRRGHYLLIEAQKKMLSA